MAGVLALPFATPAASAGIYGPGIGADSLGNAQVGGRHNSQVAYRFRATQSSALLSVGLYIIGDGDPGYAGGTGGTIRITVRPDDGSAAHLPSGTILASRDVVRPGGGAHNEYTFPSPARLIKGRVYHVVFTNIDPSPTVNFVSVDGLFVYDETPRFQPRFTNTDWATLVKHGSGAWSADRGAGSGTITPIMQLTYANGVRAGLGYMEVWVRATQTISGTARVRQVFTVRGRDRRVTSVGIRLRHVRGSGPLTIALRRADGKTIVKGTIPASRIGDRTGWSTLRLPRQVRLAAGSTYQLVLSTNPDTTYSVFVIRQGSSYRYEPSTFFADGYAQISGAAEWLGWNPGWGGPSVEGDLQFYMRTV